MDLNIKLHTLLLELNKGLVEREQVIKSALLTLLAGENLLMIGPPGTGKSLVARRIVSCLADSSEKNAGSDYFEYLLTKFSTPEEIFGPLSISELKADRFRRNTLGYLPTVKLGFLDEIFKASSSILNALLTILNERVYHNGNEVQKVPLQALIAASNELPTDQEELNALYDRFLVRIFVDYVKQDNLHLLFEPDEKFDLSGDQKLTTGDLEQIRTAASSVSIPSEVGDAIRQIWSGHKEIFKEDRRESLSDRRLKKILHLLRISAVTNGRQAVDLSDVVLLKDCLWNHQENAEKVLQLILQTLTQFSTAIPSTAAAQLANSADDSAAYELAEDGVTLLPITTDNEKKTDAHSAKVAQAHSHKKTVIKGFKGSGTELDPLLIETFHDLADLARPEVGGKGYFFRQINDIDASKMETWPSINFYGVYDGNGKSIKGSGESIFVHIRDSTIKNLKIEGWMIAESASKLTIENCMSSTALLGSGDGCKISHCSAEKIAGDDLCSSIVTNCSVTEMIADSIKGGRITSCESSGQLCTTCANGALVSDCYLEILKSSSKTFMSLFGSSGDYGYTAELLSGSIIERSFFTGSTISCSSFSAFAERSEGTIRNCAVGAVGFVNNKSSWGGRICNRNDGKLQNNISIDKNMATRGDQTDGQDLAAALFTQRYFEHSLGWDFETVWLWDDKKNHPVLRDVCVGRVQKVPAKAPEQQTMDLLTTQMKANIWI